jgi:hypothetical protein
VGTTTPGEALDVSGKANINDGSNNVLISTGNSTITATNTVAVGYQALTALTTADGSTAVGYQALSSLTGAAGNTAVGYKAGVSVTGVYNTILGHNVGQNMTSATKNVVIGHNGTGNGIATGTHNTIIGYQTKNSGSNSIEGLTAVGSGAGTSGNTQSTHIGYQAGLNNGGTFSTTLGASAGRQGTKNSIVAIGANANYNIGGNFSVAIGKDSAAGTDTVTIGYDAGSNSTDSVFIGYQAGNQETNNNRLYIENSNSTTPLIYGEFDNDLVRINGDFEVTGGVKIEKTSNTDYDYRGDVVYFGATTSMTQGDLYYFNSSGNWAQADADAASSSGGVLLAIALGTASDTDGMLLRGTFTMEATAIDGTEATGDELYVSTTAGHITSDVSAYTTGDVVRVIGYCLDGTNGQIWFNPSNDFITLA